MLQQRPLQLQHGCYHNNKFQISHQRCATPVRAVPPILRGRHGARQTSTATATATATTSSASTHSSTTQAHPSGSSSSSGFGSLDQLHRHCLYVPAHSSSSSNSTGSSSGLGVDSAGGSGGDSGSGGSSARPATAAQQVGGQALDSFMLWMQKCGHWVQGGLKGLWKSAESFDVWSAVWAGGQQHNTDAGLRAASDAVLDHLVVMDRAAYVCLFDQGFARLSLVVCGG